MMRFCRFALAAAVAALGFASAGEVLPLAGDTPETVEKMMAMGLDYIPTNVTVPLELK